MKTPLVAALLCACLLTGCAGVPPGSSAIDVAVGNANSAVVLVSPTLASIESKISAALVKACGWQPAISTTAGLAAGISGSVTAETLTSVVTGLATAACGLLTAPASNGIGLLDRAPIPKLNGVSLVGKFVR